jgi:hypothetical protein
MKMFILVKGSLPRGLAAEAAVRASFAAFFQFKDSPGVLAWLSDSALVAMGEAGHAESLKEFVRARMAICQVSFGGSIPS